LPGLSAGRLGRVFVVVHCLLETLDCAAQITAEVLQLRRSENQNHDAKNDQQLNGADSA
jgi:hypothetical protein